MHSANDAVSSLLDEQGNPLGCGTTALAAVVTGDHLFWCSTGDSRIYLHRDRTLYQLTTDQTYMLKLMEAVNAGNMTLQEAESHPKRNALISYVGSGEHLVIDCPPSAEPLRSGDTVLLATDGLYRTLSDGDIRTMLEDGSNAENTAITLVESAIARGGNRQDNTTVAIIRIN